MFLSDEVVEEVRGREFWKERETFRFLTKLNPGAKPIGLSYPQASPDFHQYSFTSVSATCPSKSNCHLIVSCFGTWR